MKENWKIWEKDQAYGENFYERAIGDKAEMESSKAVAKLVKKYLQSGEKVLDIGCGGGHYLFSLEKEIELGFYYHGIDATKNYVEIARKAYDKREHSKCLDGKFEVGDIFDLKNIPDNYAEIVMCNNVLLHLPSIEKPISELCRVSKRNIIIRTLIGKTSFRIKHINEPESYDLNGEPINFHYFNIYSKQYIEKLLNEIPDIQEFKIYEDRDFIPDNIGMVNYENKNSPHNLTTIIDGMQVNNYIISPWSFIEIKKI